MGRKERSARRSPRRYVVFSPRARKVVVREDCSIIAPERVSNETEVDYAVDFLSRPLIFGTMFIVLAGAGGGALAAVTALTTTILWLALSYLRSRGRKRDSLAEKCPRDKVLEIARHALEACKAGRGETDGYRVICPGSREASLSPYISAGCLATGASLLLWMLIGGLVPFALLVASALACVALLYVSAR